MRPMWHQNYIYRPWSEARRRAASTRMKAIIAAKQAGTYNTSHRPGIWSDPQKYLEWANSIVGRDIPHRDDIIQNIMLSLLEKRHIISELQASRSLMRQFMREFFGENYEGRGFAVSIDAQIPGTDGLTLSDVLAG